MFGKFQNANPDTMKAGIEDHETRLANLEKVVVGAAGIKVGEKQVPDGKGGETTVPQTDAEAIAAAVAPEQANAA